MTFNKCSFGVKNFKVLANVFCFSVVLIENYVTPRLLSTNAGPCHLFCKLDEIFARYFMRF